MDILERFLAYTKINTTTDKVAGARGLMPSSKNQLELARLIKNELLAMGVRDVSFDERAPR